MLKFTTSSLCKIRKSLQFQILAIYVILVHLIQLINANEVDQDKAPTNVEKYGYGTVAILLVSGLAFIGIALFPCINKRYFPAILQILTGLAIGTLFSDAMLHMIPEILEVHGGEDHEHESRFSTERGKIVLAIASLYLFWLFQTIMGRVAGTKKSSGGAHGHSHAPILQATKVNHNNAVHSDTQIAERGDTSDERAEKKKVGICDFRIFKRIDTLGWVILAGDSLHNFADGLAVGASFAISLKTGFSTTIAIVAHEIPHELGNYAVLIQTGFTHFQALFMNWISAMFCLLGFYVGVALPDNSGASSWIFAVTAGMFLYIALVELLPGLVPVDDSFDWKIFAATNVAMICGFLGMLLLAMFEDDIVI